MKKYKRGRLVLSEQDYKNLIQQILRRDGWKCRVCKCRNCLQGHHVVFRSNGGDDAEWNMLTVCMTCHNAIHKRYLVILPPTGKKDVDCNGPVKLLFLQGWKPGKAVPAQ